ncbi:AraC family transcriptional regulator [Cohnella sp. GCM10027633]|uniref:helix-turn-helix transcriptional regulator n=1 Tax=unclassified Cohnella TaxID=2636738 RepID=UPI003640C4F9
MAFMDIPYSLVTESPLPECRFDTIWKVHADASYRNHRPEGFHVPGLFATFEGKGVLELRGERRELHPGTFVFVPRGESCAYFCPDGDWKFYFIHMDTLDMARRLDLPIGVPVSSSAMPEAVRICERLIDDLIIRPKGYEFATQLKLQQLLLLFAQEQETSEGTRRYPELDDVLYEMHKNIAGSADMEDFVRRSGLSRTVFYERFRARTGKSPSRYTLELKLASAKANLETTSASVKEIAAALRFYDEFHFSKLFKQYFGLSPRDYRRSIGRAPSTR